MACHGGCCKAHEVNVGWFGCEAKQLATVRTAPHGDAPVKDVINPGQRVGIQSTRNPGAHNDPPMRNAVNGYVWGYVLNGGATGWIRASALLKSGWGPWARGPAGVDFHVGYDFGKRGSDTSCRGIVIKKNKRRVVRSEDVYLRYAPKSTAFWYLHKGDVVDAHFHHIKGWTCVEVVRSSAGAPAGTKGWVQISSLRRQR